MGTMAIRVEAPPVTFAFNWEGTQGDIDNIMTFIEDQAAAAGITPEQLAQSTLRYLPTMGVMKEPGAQQIQMMAIMYTVLNCPTKTPGRPGSVHRYAADEHIVARLTVSDRDVAVRLEGYSEDASD
jgi:hypothetical protein